MAYAWIAATCALNCDEKPGASVPKAEANPFARDWYCEAKLDWVLAWACKLLLLDVNWEMVLWSDACTCDNWPVKFVLVVEAADNWVLSPAIVVSVELYNVFN